MAINMVDSGSPWLRRRDVASVQARLDRVPGVGDQPIVEATKRGRTGHLDFAHFWLYPVIASPFVGLTRLLDGNPIHGFTALNVLLLAAAWTAAWRRLGAAMAAALIVGPAVWWLDKPAIEIYTFALLTIGLLYLGRAPGVACAILGLAAAQNPPIAVVFAAAVVAGWFVSRTQGDVRGIWAGAVAGAALIGLHVGYALWQHGTPTLLTQVTRRAVPTLVEWTVVLIDPNLGVVWAAPGVVSLAGVAAVRLRWRWSPSTRAAAVVTLVSLPVLLLAFAQTTNMHHGGTPGMSRYGLWLLPLFAPWLAAWNEAGIGRWRHLVSAVALVSATTSLAVFHPGRTDYAREPTWIASWLWREHPTWTNSPPEVFAGVLEPLGERQLPIATGGCTKALLIGRGDAQGMWPLSCRPVEIPPDCRRPAALCYANRTGNHVTFSPTIDSQPDRFRYTPSRVWPMEAEAGVRTLLDAFDWPTLQQTDGTAESVLRRVDGVADARAFEGRDRVFIVLAMTDTAASVTLRLPGAMTGASIDPATGTRIRDVADDPGRGERSTIDVPPGRRVVVLALRSAP